VSTANVSQLALDLLIASLCLKQTGIFDTKDIVPVIGGREDGEEGITSPLECAHFLGPCGRGLLTNPDVQCMAETG
jgi:hypothetical protein